MAYSGIPGYATPNDGDGIIRRIENIERVQREAGPAVAKSVRGIVASLTAVGDVSDFENHFSGTVTNTLQESFSRFIDIPEGYDKVSVIAYAAATARNDGVSPDFFIISAGVWTYGSIAGPLDGGTGTSTSAPFGPSEWASPRATNLLSYQGLKDYNPLSVGTLSVEIALMVRTNSGVAVTKDTGSVSAIAIFSK